MTGRDGHWTSLSSGDVQPNRQTDARYVHTTAELILVSRAAALKTHHPITSPILHLSYASFSTFKILSNFSLTSAWNLITSWTRKLFSFYSLPILRTLLHWEFNCIDFKCFKFGVCHQCVRTNSRQLTQNISFFLPAAANRHLANIVDRVARAKK
jgi:hypothetical protein